MRTKETCHECELIETCSFYWNYRNHPKAVDRNLVERFCHSDLASVACRIIAYYKDNNEFPPSDMTPEGDFVDSGMEYLGGILTEDRKYLPDSDRKPSVDSQSPI